MYFREIFPYRYIPRGIACDIDYSKVSPLLNKSNIWQTPGKTVKRSVFASGMYMTGSELCAGGLYDCIRKEVEVCDTFRGFQFHYNLGGGAGSGLTSSLTGKLQDDYSRKTQLYFTCFPGKQYSVPFEPYNVALGLFHQLEQIKMTEVSITCCVAIFVLIFTLYHNRKIL